MKNSLKTNNIIESENDRIFQYWHSYHFILLCFINELSLKCLFRYTKIFQEKTLVKTLLSMILNLYSKNHMKSKIISRFEIEHVVRLQLEILAGKRDLILINLDENLSKR